MITYVHDDLFQSPAKVLVNTVNTVGVMGKGLAADFKRYFPAMFDQYQTLCETGKLTTGKLMLYRTPHKWVLNFPTKKHWRSSSHIEYIEAGLQKFVSTYAEQGITSVSFPRLGSGLGGLDWDEAVQPLMEAYLAPLPIAVYIHLYDPTTEARNPRTIATWLNGIPQTVSFDKFWRELTRLLNRQDEFLTCEAEGQRQSFRVTPEVKRRSRNLILTRSGNGGTIYLSESMLSDLWTYIQEAGYSLPRNFPDGMDAYAGYIVGLLSQLKDVKAVSMRMGVNSEIYKGLLFIPPVERTETRVVHLNETVS